MVPSRAERGGLSEQGVGLGECRCGSESGEKFAGVVEDRGSVVWLAEVDEAAAVAEQRECVLGDHAELLPALGGVCVAVRGGLEVAAGFGEGGGGR